MRLIFSRLRRPWIIIVVVATLVLVGWGVFHPEFRPDANTINPEVRKELAKTGFRQTRGIRAARLETIQSIGGLSEKLTSEQKIAPIDELITEKQTRRRGAGVSEETRGLYVGPLAVVRFNRAKPPIIGDLLPFQFWSASHMSTFVVVEADRFPDTKGGKMRARVTYEDRYAGGELLQTESRRLQCDVTNVIDAAALLPGLSGVAARIECHEEPEPDGRKVGPSNPQTWSQGHVAFSHWYIMDQQWSIPIEGEFSIRIGGDDEIRKWSSKVVSFERSAQ